MTTRTPEQLVATLIQAVADDPRKRYYATPEGPYVDRNVEEARQAVLAMMRPAADAAADAAAPAVGVPVEEAVSWLAIYQQAVIDVYLRGGGVAKNDLTEYTNHLIALLTAQPEPGTHDDAGQPEGATK